MNFKSKPDITVIPDCEPKFHLQTCCPTQTDREAKPGTKQVILQTLYEKLRKNGEQIKKFCKNFYAKYQDRI